jgi:porphobilinogen synthase
LSGMTTRPRRLRARPWLREMAAESRLAVANLVLPVFFCEDRSQESTEIQALGIRRYRFSELADVAREAAALGIPSIALFPVIDPSLRSETAKYALTDDLACRAIRAIKEATPNIGVITDVAIDRYTTHGQDGIVRNGIVLNDESVEILAHMALAHVKAGADVLAPSDMLDGRIRAIRSVLNAEGHHNVPIISYTAKYASVQYGPFRDAVGSSHGLATSGLGPEGKKTYFMDIRNRDEAVLEAKLDLEEGADALMVKPALSFLDTILAIRQATAAPIAAYQVSGEFANIRSAAASGWCAYETLLLETLTCIHRAGAQMIFCYGAIDAAKALRC